MFFSFMNSENACTSHLLANFSNEFEFKVWLFRHEELLYQGLVWVSKCRFWGIFFSAIPYYVGFEVLPMNFEKLVH
jgi:hypothetical protein